MTLQTQLLADLVRRERAFEASPRRLERRRVARLAEAIARCCRATVAGRAWDALIGVVARAAQPQPGRRPLSSGSTDG